MARKRYIQDPILKVLRKIEANATIGRVPGVTLEENQNEKS